MAQNLDLPRLLDLFDKFERLDKSIFDEIQKGNLEVIDRTLEAKKEIKRFLRSCKPIGVNKTLARKIKQIRDNYGYNIDRVISNLSDITGQTISQESEEGIDYVSTLFTEGTADYVDDNFFTRKNQVGTIIVSETLPNNFIHHFDNIRECYALGLFEATIMYCRALIETGCFEAFKRRGNVHLDSKVKHIEEFKLSALMASIKKMKMVSEENWEKADQVRTKANMLLHTKSQIVKVTEQEAFKAIQDTFAIIEEIFHPKE